MNLVEGKTFPPNFLTETELITLMDKNGIGTGIILYYYIIIFIIFFFLFYILI